jgi:hypothetical protein
MKSRVFLAFLLAGTIGWGRLTAAEPPQFSPPDARKEPDPHRGEKTETLAADLATRSRKMLDLQTAVYEGTKALHKIIQGRADKKPRPEDHRAALKLAANEKDIVLEATKAIKFLEADGTAPAFTEVFQEMRKDMERLRLRLKGSDVGTDTQALEEDIIETLKEIISSFKKR